MHIIDHPSPDYTLSLHTESNPHMLKRNAKIVHEKKNGPDNFNRIGGKKKRLATVDIKTCRGRRAWGLTERNETAAEGRGEGELPTAACLPHRVRDR